MTCTPIVFLIFNRPLETMRVFDKIREVRPEKLLVVADGPRSSRPGEAALCRQTRAVLDRVDWPCQVLTDFADTNMGCGRRIASGLEWAFEEVEEAIIVEDDCLPDPSFFPYCDELLERYRSDERIMMISGNNFQNGASRTSDSYYFSHLPQIWGWATWRRGWALFNPNGTELLAGLRTLGLTREFDFDGAFQYTSMLQDQISGANNSWAIRWYASAFLANKVTLYPGRSLVINIGTDASGTHCGSTDTFDVTSSTSPLHIGGVPVADSPEGRAAFTEFGKRNHLGSAVKHRLGRLARKLRLRA